MIKIQNLNKSYGDKKVINDLSIDFQKCDKYALMGKSGIGKTTLVSLIAGIIKPDNGYVDHDGVISVVFQEDRLLEHLTPLENLLLVNSNVSVCSNILDELELSADKNTRTSKLSGGMKRRVSIGRALVYPHDILILDEPFKGLDEKTKTKVAQIISKNENTSTLILITHSLEEAQLINCKIIQLKSDEP